MFLRSFIVRLLSVSLVAIAGAAPALAQSTYPNKPVRLVVPYAPGGPSDIVARAIGQELAESLKQPVVIDNKPGANEAIAADYVAKSTPDGYTLLFATDAALSLNKYLYRKLPYDPEKDLVPVMRIGDSQMVLVAPESTRSLADFVAKAKATPGTMAYASAGAGNSSHLAMEQFSMLNGIKMTHAPYKGVAAAVPDLIAGRVSGLFSAVVAVLPQVQKNNLRALAISGPARFSLLPDVPTFAELGYPGFQAFFYQGIVAPKGTPPEIVNALSTHLRRIVQAPAFRAHSIQAWGLEPVGDSPQEFAAFLARDRASAAERIKVSGATLD